MVTAFLETTQMLGGAVTTLLEDASRHPELRPALTPLLVNIGRAAAVLLHHQASGRLAVGDVRDQLGRLIGPILAAGVWARTGVMSPAADPATIVGAFLNGHRST